MTARGRAFLATGLVLVTLGLVLAGIAYALGTTSGAETANGGTTGGTATTSGSDTSSPTSTDVSAPTTDATTPGPETTGPSGGTDSTNDTTTPGSSDTTASTATPTTASPGELPARLAAAAASVGFTLLGTTDPEWKLVSVDSASTANGPYVATSYERGSAYFSTSQERATPFPVVPNTVAVPIHGRQGDLLDLGHVVVIRWVEGETNIIFNTNLPREEALAQAEALQPIR